MTRARRPDLEDTPSAAGADVDVDEAMVRAAARSRLFGSPATPVRIGRHVVIERLGQGGMGVVYAAYDPELDRKIAVKLVKTGGGSEGSEAARRLQREARAMARVGHPNVISVYDVGTHTGEVYIAMEFVDGLDLARWVRDGSPKPWKEVLSVFSAAGQGLAAAHAAGLIHRDFKPANVLRGVDGEVRVLDFGLVRSERVAASTSPGVASSPQPAQESLTSTGAVVGTPAYMAPEQFGGDAVDARTDQFSFCVSLYEALYGERPFAGATVAELAAATAAGELRETAKGATVPRWIHRVIARGLSPEPDDRHESMAELLRALNNDPRRRQRIVAVWAAAAVAVAAAGYGALYAAGGTARRCAHAADGVVEVWSADAGRRQVRHAMERSGLPYAARSAAAVETSLDDYAASWATMAMDNCEATHVRGEQSSDLLDLRTACLHERLQHLDALVDVLADADAKTVGRATRLASSLGDLARCADASWLRARIPLPDDPAAAEAVTTAREQLARVTVLAQAGRAADALPEATAVLAAVEPLAYRPALAEALFWTGDLTARTGSYAEGARTLERAFWQASEIGYDDIVLRSATSLTYVVGVDQSRPSEGEQWARHGLAAAARLDAPPRRAGFVHGNLGNVFLHAGRADEAIANLENAVRLIESDPMAPKSSQGSAVENLALAVMNTDDLDRAEILIERALALQEDDVGPDHPTLFTTLNSAGQLYARRGEYQRALDAFERATAILEAVDPNDPSIGLGLSNQGYALDFLDHDVESARRYERAVSAFERSLGPDHPRVAAALRNLCTMLEPALARPHLERALSIERAALADDHENTARTRWMLAQVLRDLDVEPARARSLAEQALPVFERIGNSMLEDVRAFVASRDDLEARPVAR